MHNPTDKKNEGARMKVKNLTNDGGKKRLNDEVEPEWNSGRNILT